MFILPLTVVYTRARWQMSPFMIVSSIVITPTPPQTESAVWGSTSTFPWTSFIFFSESINKNITQCESWFQFHTSSIFFGIRTVECIVAVMIEETGQIQCSLACFNSQPLYKKRKKKTPRCRLASANSPGRKGGREKGDIFFIPGLCRAWGKRSQRWIQEKKWLRASFCSGRKEEFPLASVWFSKMSHLWQGSASFSWQAVCDQLSPFPSLSPFLCHFTFLPSNPDSLDSARLQPLQRLSNSLRFRS